MAAFFTDLVSSIFTPGPTHTLIVATNASFACLQLVLLALLIATYSIHFVILSFLCAGLWWAINWFVAELEAHKAAEANEGLGDGGVGLEGQSETEGEQKDETVIGREVIGSKDVEILEGSVLKVRGSPGESRAESGTEDEWEKVSENEKDK